MKAELHLSPKTGPAISPYLFGSLVEHFGHGLYGGLWDRDRRAPRADVQAAISALGTTMFRYPGGCFADWYHWRDGVGPAATRPIHAKTNWTSFHVGDLAADKLGAEFGPPEDNQVGTDEILRYCVDNEIEPLLVANAGTGSPEEAAAWVTYCNSGSAPRPVRWWGIGNEMYGVWELGHCSPEEYAERFLTYRRAMTSADPDIRLVAVGCGDGTTEAAHWNEAVLARCGAEMDALSVHWYFPGPRLGRCLGDDEAGHLQVAAAPDHLGRMLDEVIAIADRVAPDRTVQLALDEWNLWSTWQDLLNTNHRLVDAVFFAGCWNEMINRAGRLSQAMISHQVNCMAPIQTRGDRLFVTSSYLVMQMYRRHVRGRNLPTELMADRLPVTPFEGVTEADTPLTTGPRSSLTDAPVITAAATADGNGVAIFLATRALGESVTVDITGLPQGRRGRLRRLRGPDPLARNDVDQPAVLGFTEQPLDSNASGHLRLELPAAAACCVLFDGPWG